MHRIEVALGSAGLMALSLLTACGESKAVGNGNATLPDPTKEQSPTVSPSPDPTATLWPKGGHGLDFSDVKDPELRAILESSAKGTVIPQPTILSANPKFQATAFAEATIQAKPTEKPATSTPESVKKPENLLPEESVYFGSMKSKDGKTALVIIAHLPGEEYNDKVFFTGLGNNNLASGLFQIDKTEGGTLYTSTSSGRIHMNLALENGKLTGEIDNLMGGSSWMVDTTSPGIGRAKFYEASKKAWATIKLNDPSMWTGVPDKTIDDILFGLAIGVDGRRNPINPPLFKNK